MKRFVVFVAVMLSVSALQARDLFRVLPEPNTGRIHSEALSASGGGQTQSVRVQMDQYALAYSSEPLMVTLGGKIYQVTSGKVEWIHHDVVTYENVGDYETEFTLGDSQKPSVIVHWKNVMAGMFVTDQGSYELGTTSDSDVNFLTKVDMSKFKCEAVEPKEGNNRIHALGVNTSSRHRAAAFPNVNYVINMAEFYTPNDEKGMGGKAQMEALMQAAVAMLNESEHRSGNQNATYRLAYTGLIQFDERGPGISSNGDVLSWIAASADAAQIRATYSAQLVGIWYDGGGGVALAPRSYDQFVPQNGFHAIGRTDGLIIAGFEHEVGHNVGRQHQFGSVATSSFDDFLFARAECAAGFQTIMSQCSVGNWIPYFSNSDPSLTYNGQPMGSEMEDNVRMGRIGAALVANYFPAQVSKSNP